MRVIIKLDIRVELAPTGDPSPSQQASRSFQTQEFLQALFEAYLTVAEQQSAQPLVSAPIIPLVDVHRLVTRALGLTRTYSKEKFARDIYRLHSSGADITKSGAYLSNATLVADSARSLPTPPTTTATWRSDDDSKH